LLTGLHGGAHGPDIGIDGLDSDGRNVRQQLTLKEPAADVRVLVS
jgi:hypothetical protein